MKFLPIHRRARRHLQLEAASGASPAAALRLAARTGFAVLVAATAGCAAAAAADAVASQTPAQNAASTAKPADVAGKLPVVSIVPAKVQEIVETAIVSGTLVPRDEIMVAAEIEGLAVVEILVEEGDKVGQGQVLARLQRSTLDTQVAQNAAMRARAVAAAAQSQASIAEVQANLTEAGGTLERSRQLKDNGYTSAATYDKSLAAKQAWEAKKIAAESALSAAQYDIANLDAQRREIDVRLGRTEIKAPKAGIVSRRTARLGAVASGVGEPLFRIIAGGEIELEAEIADVNLPRVAAGMPVTVTPAGFEEPLAGAVRLVSPEVDKSTRLGRLRVSLPATKSLPIGAFARGLVELGRRRGVSVPQSAITFGKGGPSVQIIDKGQVRNRLVRLGLAGNGIVEVRSGLQDGEQVVARAGSFLRDGDRVTGVAAGAKEGATQ